MIKLLTQLILFLKEPKEFPPKELRLNTKIKWLFLALIFDFLLVSFLILIQSIPTRLGFIEMEDNHVIKLISEEENSFGIFFLIIILVPFLEELIFRLPLRIKPLNFLPFIIAIPFGGGIALTYNVNGTASWFTLIPLCFVGIILFFTFNKPYFNRLKVFLQAKYKFYFYFVAISFAFVHLTNFPFSLYLLLFAPLLVLPQFAVALIIGFLRNNCGFFFGFLFHGIHNAVFIFPLLYFYTLTLFTTPAVITKINANGYQIQVNEESFSERHEDLIITPNEIKIQGTMPEIISKLTRKNKRDILFRKNKFTYKKISLSVKNDTAYSAEKTDSIVNIALQKLMESYDLEMKVAYRPTMANVLFVSNKKLFKSRTSQTLDVHQVDNVRLFQNAKDTIRLDQIQSTDLIRLLKINYNLVIKDEMEISQPFSIEVPAKSLPDLKRFLKKNYGIKIKHKRTQKEVLIIK